MRLENKGAVNMRTFEIPTAGGFLLHEGSSDLAQLLRVGEAYGDFESPEHFMAQAAHFL
ncbi:MAG: hypothetical protein ACI8PT_004457 [Gammaproteobacteria bacterium]